MVFCCFEPMRPLRLELSRIGIVIAALDLPYTDLTPS